VLTCSSEAKGMLFDEITRGQKSCFKVLSSKVLFLVTALSSTLMAPKLAILKSYMLKNLKLYSKRLYPVYQGSRGLKLFDQITRV
jgi:hypothetical protein